LAQRKEELYDQEVEISKVTPTVCKKEAKKGKKSKLKHDTKLREAKSGERN
jgi:hypothetical protein